MMEILMINEVVINAVAFKDGLSSTAYLMIHLDD